MWNREVPQVEWFQPMMVYQYCLTYNRINSCPSEYFIAIIFFGLTCTMYSSSKRYTLVLMPAMSHIGIVWISVFSVQVWYPIMSAVICSVEFMYVLKLSRKTIARNVGSLADQSESNQCYRSPVVNIHCLRPLVFIDKLDLVWTLHLSLIPSNLDSRDISSLIIGSQVRENAVSVISPDLI